MRPEDVLAWVRAAPFRPFRIRLNSGQKYEIRHPEMLHVGRSIAHVFWFSGEPTDPYERFEMISLLLIERIEPVETPARA
jgi:hypothetical protein